jgi:hypothetical protein
MIIVTRHSALVAYLAEIGLVTGNEPVYAQVDGNQVRGQDVIGVLPLHLAALAASVTEVPLNLSLADRGQELSLEHLREIAGVPVTYKVTVLA